MFQRSNLRYRSEKSAETVFDDEFGSISCKRTASRYVRIRIDSNGNLIATLPKRAALRMVLQLVDSSRVSIRKMVASHERLRMSYENDMPIGHSHRLFIDKAANNTFSYSLKGQVLKIHLPKHINEDTPEGRDYISDKVKKALRREATAYLPRRLMYLAEKYGFHYERIRFGNPKGRWGSCSSSGTISLNVALMNTPHEVIDYVLLHELAHTKQMNHSTNFWNIVETCMPEYKIHRKALKSLSPIC